MILQTEYKPMPAQARFHALARLHRFGLFLGGVGSGKTIAGVHEVLYSAIDNPGANGLIGAPTYPMLRDVVIPTWHQWIPSEIFRYLRSDQCFELWTGQRVFLRSATEPDRARGLNVGFGWLDEMGMVRSRIFWDIIKGRLRDPRATNPRLCITTTPEGRTYLIREFMRGESDHFVVRARTADNKYLDPEYETSLRLSYGEEFAAQELDAQIIELRGLAWPIFSRLHVIQPREAQERSRTFFGGVDWGFTAPAALVIGGHDGETWRLCTSWYKRGKTREAIARAAAELGKQFNVACWYSDHDPEGVDWFRKMGLRIDLADKTVESGIQHVRSLLRPRTNGQPRFFVANTMTDWQREAEAYSFPEGKEEPVGENGDHLMDATRYMIYTHAKKFVKLDFRAGGGRSRYAIANEA